MEVSALETALGIVRATSGKKEREQIILLLNRTALALTKAPTLPYSTCSKVATPLALAAFEVEVVAIKNSFLEKPIKKLAISD